MANQLLSISNINVFYGDAQAIWDVTFQVNECEIFSIIGSNGAGKSTVLKTVAGVLAPFSGQIIFDGIRVEGLGANIMVDHGVALVPEGRGLFPDLTVLENLELGAFTKRARPGLKKNLDWIADIFPIVERRKTQLAGNMSGGEQQMIAIGRALMSRPKLLMLDEPSLGLAPLVVKTMFETIEVLNQQKVTILLVEQNIHQALKAAGHALVLKTGRITMIGRGDELMSDPEVQRAYMGTLKQV